MPSIMNNAVTVSTTATLLCEGSPRRTWLTFMNNGSSSYSTTGTQNG